MHLAWVYKPDGSVTMYVNGVFNQTFANCGNQNAAPYITLAGRMGNTGSDLQATYAYIRGWRRALNATEVQALVFTPGSHNAVYSIPRITMGYAYGYYFPGTANRVLASLACCTSNSVLLDHLSVNATGDITINATATSSFMNIDTPIGGTTVVATTTHSLVPGAYSALWDLPAIHAETAARWPLLAATYPRSAPLSMIPIQTNTRIIARAAATSVTHVVASPPWVRGNRGANNTRACFLCVFNRPLSAAVDPATGIVAMPPLPASAFAGAGNNNPGFVWTSVNGTAMLVCGNVTVSLNASVPSRVTLALPRPPSWLVTDTEATVRLLDHNLVPFTGIPLDAATPAHGPVLAAAGVYANVYNVGVGPGGEALFNFTFTSAVANFSAANDAACDNAGAVAVGDSDARGMWFVVAATPINGALPVDCTLSPAVGAYAAGLPWNKVVYEPPPPPSPSTTPTASVTASTTTSATASTTTSATASISPSSTSSPSPTTTATSTQTPSSSSTLSHSTTGTTTTTGTGTRTATGTATGTRTATGTATGTGTGTGSAAASASGAAGPSQSASGTAAATSTPSKRPVSVSMQDVLFAYSVTSQEMCAVDNLVDRFLNPNSTIAPAARHSLASALGYNDSAAFVTGLLVCNGAYIPVNRTDPVNTVTLEEVQALMNSAVSQSASPTPSGSDRRTRLLGVTTGSGTGSLLRVGTGPGRLLQGGSNSNSMTSLNVTVDGSAIAVELGISFPRIVADVLAKFFTLTLSNADPALIAEAAANVTAMLSSTAYAEFTQAVDTVPADPATSSTAAVDTRPASLVRPQPITPKMQTWFTRQNTTSQGPQQVFVELAGVATGIARPIQQALNLTSNVTSAIIPTTRTGVVWEAALQGSDGGSTPTPKGPGTDVTWTKALGALAAIPLLFCCCLYACRKSRHGNRPNKGVVDSVDATGDEVGRGERAVEVDTDTASPTVSTGTGMTTAQLARGLSFSRTRGLSSQGRNTH